MAGAPLNLGEFEINRILLQGDARERAATDPAPRRARLGSRCSGRSLPTLADAAPGDRRSTCRGTAGPPHDRSADRASTLMADDIAGPHRPPRARQSRTSSATRSAAASPSSLAVQAPGEGAAGSSWPSANIRPDAIYRPRCWPSRPRSSAARGRVHEGHADVRALCQRVAPHPEDFPRLLDKIGRVDGEGLRLQRTEVRGLPVPTLIWSPPTRTWRRRATRSRSSICSTVGCATAAGRARAGRRAATRSRSCRA